MRPARAEDEGLLFELFAADKRAEFAAAQVPAAQAEMLVEMQYRARRQSYSQNYPEAMDTILCLEDGAPVGRNLVDRQTDCYYCVDLAVLPAHRNRGVGTWALRQIQQQAALESAVFRLRVLKNNSALRLYARLGFTSVWDDEMYCEMEWRPPSSVASAARIEARSALLNGAEIDREDVLGRIFAFLDEIGLSICFEPVPSGFLPGVQMVSGGLRVDLDALLYPGDLLHEAGHLAVMTPERRAEEFPQSSEPAEEMGAIAWSYAAALHVGLPPEIVFHEYGYRGQARALAHDFATGNCIGLPYLWWIGLTTQPFPGRPSIYPGMLRWLREAAPDAEPDRTQEESFEAQQSMASSHCR